LPTLTHTTSYLLPIGNSPIASGTRSTPFSIPVDGLYSHKRKELDDATRWDAWASSGEIPDFKFAWVLADGDVSVILTVGSHYYTLKAVAGIPFVLPSSFAVESPNSNGVGTDTTITGLGIRNNTGGTVVAEVFLAN
jgi:hypothetical protein